MKLSDELREAAEKSSELKTLLISAADEIDRLTEKLNNKLVYEQWLDQKYDKERD